MWTEFHDFVVDGDVGLFVRFRGDVMMSEVVFMGATQTTDVATQEMPSVDALRAALVPS